MNDTVKLFCLVYGDTPSKHAFSIKILKTDTIDVLKRLIKNKKSPKLDHFTADELELWKVNIPMSELATLDGNFDKDKYIGNGSLSPFSDIGDIFLGPPARKHLHIIVQIPTTAELLQPEEHEAAFYNNSVYALKEARRYARRTASEKSFDDCECENCKGKHI